MRTRAYEHVFDDLVRLWIYPTPIDELLLELQAEVRRALAAVTDAVDYRKALQNENGLRFYEARFLDRLGRAGP